MPSCEHVVAISVPVGVITFLCCVSFVLLYHYKRKAINVAPSEDLPNNNFYTRGDGVCIECRHPDVDLVRSADISDFRTIPVVKVEEQTHSGDLNTPVNDAVTRLHKLCDTINTEKSAADFHFISHILLSDALNSHHVDINTNDEQTATFIGDLTENMVSNVSLLSCNDVSGLNGLEQPRRRVSRMIMKSETVEEISIKPPLDRRVSETLTQREEPVRKSVNFNVVWALPDGVWTYLENNAAKWEFNIFEFTNMCNGQPLLFLGMHLFRDFGFFETYKLDPLVVQKWLYRIESNYHSRNPYHNSSHAADVVHSSTWMLTQSTVTNYVTDNDLFIAFFAAAIHDVDHPGLTNAFQTNTRSALSIMYNDHSILENHHLCTGFKLTLDSEDTNILSGLNEEEFKIFRKRVISQVLATDLASHFSYVDRLKTKHEAQDFDPNEQENRELIHLLALKAADLSHPAKPWKLHERWSRRVTEEFFRQGDTEKKLEVAISMFMDRETTNIPKCQQGFINFLVLPLWKVCLLWGDFEVQLKYLDNNLKVWEAREVEESKTEEIKN